MCLLCLIQSELLSTPRLTVLEGSVEELLVAEANPEEPGHHRVTGIRLGREGKSCQCNHFYFDLNFCIQFCNLSVISTFYLFDHFC